MHDYKGGLLYHPRREQAIAALHKFLVYKNRQRIIYPWVNSIGNAITPSFETECLYTGTSK